MTSKNFILGTVQLGMDYGIQNKLGKPSQEEANAIVKMAFENGIHKFDTAQAYGQSEEVLGVAFKTLDITDQVQVITKIDPAVDCKDVGALNASVRSSLKRLNIKKIHVLMLHREELLEQFDKDIFETLKREGLILKCGVSVYSPQKALQAFDTEGIECIQIPSSIVDKRFVHASVFKKAERLGKTIDIRSVYVQGLLLMNPAELPGGMQHTSVLLYKLNAAAQQYNLSVQALCLGYVIAKWPSCNILFGAESVGQVEQNMSTQPLPISILNEVDRMFDKVDENILNPAMWPKQETLC